MPGLASRESLPLATFNADLATAAHREKLQLIGD
jgi:hypothetical protein